MKRLRLALLFLAWCPFGCGAGQPGRRDACGEARTPSVMFHGDSLVVGVGSQNIAGWRQPLYGAALDHGLAFVARGGYSYGDFPQPQHQGIGGYTAAVLAPMTPTIDQQYHTDVYLIAGGTNDLFYGATVEETLAAVGGWLDAAWASGSARPQFEIILLPLLRRLDAYNKAVLEVNGALPALIRSKPFAEHVHLASEYYGSAADDDYAPDGLHLTDAGYAKAATAGIGPTFLRIIESMACD